MVAEGLPETDVCGSGSLLTGTSVIQLANGVLAPAGSCSFAVQVLVPANASGAVLNVRSPLTGQVGSSPITANPASAESELVIGALLIDIPADAPWALLLLAALLTVAAIRQVRFG
jgi:hypothetical protein